MVVGHCRSWCSLVRPLVWASRQCSYYAFAASRNDCWCNCEITILMSLMLFEDEAWRKCDMVWGWCLSPSFLTSWPCLSLPWCADCYAALNLPLALYPDPSCIRGDQLSAQSIPLFFLTDRIALRTQTWRLEEGQRSAHRLRQRWIQMKTDG